MKHLEPNMLRFYGALETFEAQQVKILRSVHLHSTVRMEKCCEVHYMDILKNGLGSYWTRDTVHAVIYDIAV